MAEEKTDGFWMFFLLVFAAFTLSLAFVTQDYVRSASVKEAQNIELELGRSTLTRINAMADGWYLKTLDKWFGKEALKDWMSADPEQRLREERLLDEHPKLQAWSESRREALLDLGFWVMRRAALFLVWLPLWIPLAFLALYHGLQDREIKKTDFGYTSPVLNHWARRSMSFISLLMLVVFLSPVALDPLLFPLMMGFWSFAAGIAIGNVQKRI